MTILMFHDYEVLRKDASEVLSKTTPEGHEAVEHLLLDCKRFNDMYRHRIVVAFFLGFVIGVVL